MRVLITGGTGLIGTALARILRERGDDVLILTRRPPTDPSFVQWDPARGPMEPQRLAGLDAVVNLAGAPIADRPWTRARRKELRASRIDATETLIRSLEKLPSPPRVFLGVGGIGRFGDRGDEILDDDAPPGAGFLAELATAWEEAHLSSARLGCRAAVLRFSIVLAAEGGAFPLMVKPFRWGLGGWLGNGLQYTSWITLRDAARGFVHLLDRDDLSGGFNGTVPEPITNYDWSKALGRALHRPVLGHAPKWALRGALGDLADDLLLSSVRAVPRRLLESGFRFEDPEAEPAFARLLAEMG